ncbi:adenine phosphoribosyltransferase [Nitrogeniibacter aestuarii]|uniref:adenine phosphoribosyltransferase n=1 Tax=Nitrogeniibacter aestuarii TaxID=2815343 RepID=UPI001D10B526|nr:adenine phosphoribosyltransferase [Nitrogeniibacter aestuarii]
MTALSAALQHCIRTVPDWPAPGIQFRDITPVFANAALFRRLIEHLAQRYADHRDLIVAGIDARGFIVGAALAHALGSGFVPLRKQGKLPHDTLGEAYALEYDQATLEVHTDAILPGQPVILIDDLIATGGTMLAAVSLIRRLGGQLHEVAAIIDLPDLGGSTRLASAGAPPYTLTAYAGC